MKKILSILLPVILFFSMTVSACLPAGYMRGADGNLVSSTPQPTATSSDYTSEVVCETASHNWVSKTMTRCTDKKNGVVCYMTFENVAPWCFKLGQ